MTEWIRVRARAEIVHGTPEQIPATIDEVGAISRQLAADAVFGSFGEFPADFWHDKWEIRPDDLVKVTADPDSDGRVFTITISLNTLLYDVSKGGVQHFLGVLAGDLFYLRIPGFTIKQFYVSEVDLPAGIVARLEQLYRAEAYSINRIKTAFQIQQSDPLLAFSFKPRVGVRSSDVRSIVLGVLEAGFHVVEFDTRYLDLTDANVKFVVSLAEEAAQIGRNGHVTRLSPNLSVASDLALPVYEIFSKTSDWPRIIKVDGGFDGMSTIQAVRRTFHGTEAPIVTCYPLLRDQLARRVPPDVFVQALAFSGADIIYPGGSPSIGKPTRELGTADRAALVQATRRYQGFASRLWPMVSLAGGIYAGQLQAYYELVRPNVGFFLGGAVALHKEGPIRGADLCCRVMKEAVRKHRANAADVQDLSSALINETEGAYSVPPGADPNTFHYVSPRDLCASIPVPRW